MYNCDWDNQGFFFPTISNTSSNVFSSDLFWIFFSNWKKKRIFEVRNQTKRRNFISRMLLRRKLILWKVLFVQWKTATLGKRKVLGRQILINLVHQEWTFSKDLGWNKFLHSLVILIFRFVINTPFLKQNILNFCRFSTLIIKHE